MSDYIFVLESHLDPAQHRVVLEMQRLATEAGMNVWLTGGAMRDVLRGARVADLDFTVEREALKTAKALAAALGGRVVLEDSLKRWAELELPGGIRASVANARTEKYSKPGGKPQIAPAGIHEDLARRDFTMNAMGLALNRGSRGLLVDPTNGQADLQNHELRATNPYIFYDDPARIYRLIRFQHVLGFNLAPRLQSQLDNAMAEGYQKHLSGTVLATEIRTLASEPNAVSALEAYDKFGLLASLSPALSGAKLNAAGLTKFEKLLHGVLPAGTGTSGVAFLRVLTEKLSSKERTDVLAAFALSKTESDELKQLDSQTKKLEASLKSAKVTRPSHVYEAISAAASDVILMVLYSSAHRVVQDRIRTYYQKYLGQAQEISEDQIAATGLKPGTAKFQKALKDRIAAHLNARPKKVVVVEPEVVPAPPANGRRKGSGA